MGVKFKRKQSAYVNVLRIGKVGFHYGVNASFSIAENRTWAETTVEWCPGELRTEDGRFWLMDIDFGPSITVGVMGGGQFGERFLINVIGFVNPHAKANAKFGLELDDHAHGLDVWTIGEATFDLAVSLNARAQVNLFNRFTFNRDLGEQHWSVFGGPVGWDERRLSGSPICSFP